MNKHIQELVSRYGNKVVENRRYLHAHPELSFQEEKTARWIRDALIKAGIPMLEGISGNSTVGYLKGERPGPSIGLRADIDALGLVEENKLPYKSITPGVMHGCGHDAHTAVLLAVAEILAEAVCRPPSISRLKTACRVLDLVAAYDCRGSVDALAASAYLHWWACLNSIAADRVERALGKDPGHSLTRLLADALASGMMAPWYFYARGAA